ncbi:MAG: DNA-binding response regulator [Luteitalea sp.]|nr:DNA-binding response regulator [Luteitalea sp.]
MRPVVVVASTAARREALVRALGSTDASAEVWSADLADLTRADADDLLVVDGVELARAVASSVGRSARLLVLDDDPAAADRLLDLPVATWGLIPARAPIAQVVAASAAVDAGLVVLPRSMRELPHLAAVAIDGAGELDRLDVDRHGGTSNELAGDESLTRREGEVLELLVQGLSNRRIGAALGISEHTVKFHVASIYGKLRASSRADLVRRALRRGLVAL